MLAALPLRGMKRSLRISLDALCMLAALPLRVMKKSLLISLALGNELIINTWLGFSFALPVKNLPHLSLFNCFMAPLLYAHHHHMHIIYFIVKAQPKKLFHPISS